MRSTRPLLNNQQPISNQPIRQSHLPDLFFLFPPSLVFFLLLLPCLTHAVLKQDPEPLALALCCDSAVRMEDLGDSCLTLLSHLNSCCIA